jgi:flagellar basal-body rod protein FlgC
MIDPLKVASRIAGAALEAQSLRLRVVAENIANVRSTAARRAPTPTCARP